MTVGDTCVVISRFNSPKSPAWTPPTDRQEFLLIPKLPRVNVVTKTSQIMTLQYSSVEFRRHVFIQRQASIRVS